MAKKVTIKTNKAKDRLIKLIRKILKEHRRSAPKVNPNDPNRHTITERSGDLFREVQPNIRLIGGKVVMEVRMMDYYQYLDAGTKRKRKDGTMGGIKPWFFTEEIMDSKELLDLSQDLIKEGVEERLIDMISDINR